MNLKKIIDKNKFLKFFKNHLFSEKSPFEENQKKIFFDFKIDSYLPFVLAKLRNNNLIIFSNFKEAAYFVNDIKSLNFSDCILFPHIDSNDDDEAKSQIKKERSNVLNFLVEKESTIVVSYSEAVIQKVVNKKTYLKQRLDDRKNKSFSQTEQKYKDGSTAILNEIRLPDGSLMQLFTDITEIKEKENRMQQLSDAIDQLPNNLMLWDKNYNLVMANQEAKIRLKENINFDIHPGVSRKDMISTAINSGFVIPPKGMTKKQYLKQRLADFDKIKKQHTFQNTLEDGTVRLVSAARLPDGGVLQFFTDITEMKKNERELERLRDGIDVLPNGMMFWDRDNYLIAHNKSAVSFLKRFKFNLKVGRHRKEFLNHMHNLSLIHI